MKVTILYTLGCLLVCALLPAQEQSRPLKGGGHLLGETAEQFYSEGLMGDVLRACQVKDWKSVNDFKKSFGDLPKTNAKDFCAALAAAKQQAAGGTRFEYRGSGDADALRSDTFTFDGGHLVRIVMVYGLPIGNIQGLHPKTFEELYAGLQEAYGAPTKTYTEPAFNAYGVRYEAHRALWMGTNDVISITEHPGEKGQTEIVAVTMAEYRRAAQAPKAANPLQ